ncbi:chitinase [Bacterioplanes sanyensis]|uniref:chitinase n=1 Tax=Bacterioplanes sanyensis TaxID=1249553 RepID=A0A222FGM5_9GAMM|nr:glycosyl hydrolase family 18 protein [Bacterioplanes sanyensis]ASP37634.1 chitinase [Bacterioplanes sanyensis]
MPITRLSLSTVFIVNLGLAAGVPAAMAKDDLQMESLTQPATPSIAWIGEQNISAGPKDFTLKWNLWYGANGSRWYLYQDGEQIHQADISKNSPNAQSGSTQVTVSKNGNYRYQVKLCDVSASGELCSLSAEATVKVAGGPTDGDDLDYSDWPKPLKQNNQAYQNSSGKQVGAYFVEWGIYGRDYQVADIPSTNLTHLYYGFIPVCGPNDSLAQANPQGYSALVSQCANKQDYEVVVHDKFAALEKSYPGDVWDQEVRGIFGQLYRLSNAQPDLVILPSVGGWTLSDPLYDIGTDAAARDIFIDSMIAFIKKYDFFDGIDIDWEFPGGGGANPALGSPQDGAGFVVLMKELRQALDALSQETGRNYQLTAAMSGGVEKLSQVDWEQAAQYMDYINIMTYDYYGAWNGVLGHQTGLYAAPDAAIDGFSAHDAVQHLLSRNVPAEKIGLGAAMYGRGWKNVSGGQPDDPFSGTGGDGISGSWEKGIEDYKVIEQKYMGGVDGTGIDGFQLFWDDIAKASYLWNYSAGTLITFDTPRSVKAKGQYVRTNNLGGIFAWEIDADNGHILNAMHQGLGHSQVGQ